MSTHLPSAGWLAALVRLPEVGPARLNAMLAYGSPEDAWHGVCNGARWVDAASGSQGRSAKWRCAALEIDPCAEFAKLSAQGFGVVDRSSPLYPERLRDDPDPAPVLFSLGDPRACTNRTVGLVGTRRCTRYGLDIASELGSLLAAAGVSVVSGLAAGIDAAAHRGALRVDGAAPIAVAASGLDRPYPKANSELWRAIGDAGVVLTEAPPGTAPQKWRFPARNRLIAGLSEVVVVVESHERGGSLYTANEAALRDRPVLAVPGPIHSSSSKGTNQLLRDGCIPVCDLTDVGEVLELVTAPALARHLAPVEVSGLEVDVLDAIGWAPTSLDSILGHCETSFDDVALAIAGLETAGVLSSRGRWLERTNIPIVITDYAGVDHRDE